MPIINALGGCGVGAIASIEGRYSRDVVERGLRALQNMEHRGGTIEEREDDGSWTRVGDGAGVTVSADMRRFFGPVLEGMGKQVPDTEPLIVGTLFTPPTGGYDAKKIEQAVREAGLEPLGMRRVPTEPSVLGRSARETAPIVVQALMGRGNIEDPQALKRELFLLQRRLGAELQQRGGSVPSMSDKTLVYKALATSDQLRGFYPDLAHRELVAKIMLVHRRFATLTDPNWTNVQPENIGENGEKNAWAAMVDTMRALERERNIPLVGAGESDSITYGHLLDFLMAVEGMSLEEALLRTAPPAWENTHGLPEPVRQFFAANRRAMGTLSECEGPMYLVATDGDVLAGKVDRMGLRPARVAVDTDRMAMLMSEMGAFDIPGAKIVRTGQLAAGQIVLVDTRTQELLGSRAVYNRVLGESALDVQALLRGRSMVTVPEGFTVVERNPKELAAFGWTQERLAELKQFLAEAKEPRSSMGRDWAPAIVSSERPPLVDYCYHNFASVTNPAIAPDLEGGAIDTNVWFGPQPHGFRGEKVYPQYAESVPVVMPGTLAQWEQKDGAERPVTVAIECTVDPALTRDGKTGGRVIQEAIDRIVQEAVAYAADRTAGIVVFAHRAQGIPIPLMLIMGAVHDALVERGLRKNVSLVGDSEEIQNVQGASMLWLQGADGVCPRAMFAQAHAMGLPPEQVAQALREGLRKNMARNGITTFMGYRGSRLFSTVGFGDDIVRYCGDATHFVPGYTLDDLWNDLMAWQERDALPHGEERHTYTPKVVKAIQTLAHSGDYADYEALLEALEKERPLRLRHLMQFKQDAASMPLEEVMSAEDIVREFFEGAHISEGSIQTLPHMALAYFFKKLMALCGSGEGGQSDDRMTGSENEDCMSTDRQVASARYGVRARYTADRGVRRLTHKGQQGAKPGDGGNVSKKKNKKRVASLRYVEPGTAVQSPANLLDQLSIEDLELLFLLTRELNPDAEQALKISIPKNLSPIIVGVAKADGDVVILSGGESSTGSATINAIEYFGMPIDIGLPVGHQSLLKAGLRDEIGISADGGLLTGEDAAIMMAMGANKSVFGTALLVALGCVYKRACHLDGEQDAVGRELGCPTGLATWTDELVQRFLAVRREDRGNAALEMREKIELGAQWLHNFLVKGVAEELRKICAAQGVRSPAELIGRTDRLERKQTGNARLDGIDLSLLLGGRSEAELAAQRSGVKRRISRIDTTQKSQAILEEAERQIVAGKTEIVVEVEVGNSDRVLGGRLAGEMIRRPEIFGGKEITVRLRGAAGNGTYFCAAPGMHLELEGYGNDDFGASIGEGVTVAVVPPRDIPDSRAADSVLGNNAFYGATGGEADILGGVGQRAFVCNSGLDAVQEGPRAKYCGEFMRRGRVILLGGEYENEIGSGMTGGQIVVHGCQDLEARVHADSVMVRPMREEEAEEVRQRIERFAKRTGGRSAVAKNIVAQWETEKEKCKVIEPRSKNVAGEKEETEVPGKRSPQLTVLRV